MHITKRKKQAIKNIVAALLSLLLLFSALRLIPALLRALPDSGADYLTGVLNGALGLDGRRYAYLPVQTPGITTTPDSAPEREESGAAAPDDAEQTDESEKLTVQPVNLCWYEPGDTPALYLHNSTDYSIDLNAYLSRTYPVRAADGSGPQVLILHTHGTESYLPDGADSYDEDESFRSENTEENVVAVGRVFADTLRGAGISVVHDETMYDRDDFNAAYTSSRAAVYAWLEKYPSIRFVFDLHRDSVFTADGENQKPVTEINGETAAQIMLVVGTDQGGAIHPNWKQNLTVAAAYQQILNTDYPTLARPVCLRTASFNQQCLPGMLLLEIGACGNTLTEAKRAARLAALSFISLYNASAS